MGYRAPRQLGSSSPYPPTLGHARPFLVFHCCFINSKKNFKAIKSPLQPAMQTTRSPARFQYNPNSGPGGLVPVAAELLLVIPSKPVCLRAIEMQSFQKPEPCVDTS